MSFMLAEPLKYAQLIALAKPQDATEPENVLWEFFDQVTIANGFTNGSVFAGGANGGGATSLATNWPQNAQLNTETYFRVWDIGWWPAVDADTGAAATTWPGYDIEQIISPNHGNAQWQLTINAKSYGPFLMSSSAQRGGLTGFLAATLTAPAQVGYANNGVFGMTFPVQNQIIVPPSTGIKFVLTSNAISGLNQASIPTQCTMRGTLYRPIV